MSFTIKGFLPMAVIVAAGVAAKLRNTTLIGKASKMRQYQFGGAKATATPSAEHAVFVADRGVGGS